MRTEREAIMEQLVSEPLAWEEICARYPTQWVALVDIDWIEDTDEFRTARVAGYGPRRADPLLQARTLGGLYPEIGHFFTGRIAATLRIAIAP
jgi:hypothetical protein